MIIIFEINIHNTNTCPRWSLYVIDIVNDDNVIKDERKRSIYLYYLVVHLNQNLYQIEKNLEFVRWSRRLQGASTSVYDALQSTCAEDLSVTRVGVSPVVSTCRIESADSSTWRRTDVSYLFHLMILIRGDHDGYSVQLRLIAGEICVAELHLDLHVLVHALAHAHTHGHAVCAPSHPFLSSSFE